MNNNLKQYFVCTYCGKSFNKKEGLTRHINETHLKTLKFNYRINCELCGKSISRNTFLKHLVNVHNITPCDACIKAELICKKKFKNIPDDIITKYLTELNINAKTLSDIKYYSKQFISFYRLINLVETFNYDHIHLFISKILPWKIQNPKASNNRKLTKLIYENNPQLEYELYKKAMLLNNPYYQHDGTTSVFSKNYKGYSGLSDEEKTQRIREYAKYDMIGRNQNQKEYWIKRGYSEQDAIIEARKHINVFSLEKCIERYGEIEGTRKFNERQIKWQNTLKSKPLEEQQDINHRKIYKNGATSKIEHDFLMNIYPNVENHNVYIKECGIVDLCVGNKVIELYGDYWHCNPKDIRFSDGTFYHPYLKMTSSEKWEFDANRIKKLQNKGYITKIVWEYEYKTNKNEIIQQCKDFLNDTTTI